MKFSESAIPQNFVTSLRGQAGLTSSNEEAVKFFEIVVAGASDFLRITKSKDKKIALSIEDLKGNMIMAAVVEYNKNEDEEGQDNWNYFWTFDKDDLEDAVVYQASQTPIQAEFVKRAASMHKMTFQVSGSLPRMVMLAASTISDYLDQNAKAGEKVTVEHEGFFVAEAEVEGEKIYKSFLPDGAMKVLIKDDAATEK